MSHSIQVRFMVEPVEALTFGAPKSFAAGEAHRLRSAFPPSPRTFQGMVRSQLLRGADPPLDLDDWSHAAKLERAALVGGSDALPPGWQLDGPLPAQWVATADDPNATFVEPWVPAPHFLMRDGWRVVRVRPVVSSHPVLNDALTASRAGTAIAGMPDGLDVESSHSDGPHTIRAGHEISGFSDPRHHESFQVVLGRPDLPDIKRVDGWLSPEGLWFALTGEGDATHVLESRRRLPPFVRAEFRPGLAIDRDATQHAQGRARHGMLYFLESWRFAPRSGLLGRLWAPLPARLRHAALRDNGGVAGRKGRLVQFCGVDSLHPVWERILDGKHLPTEIMDGARFWLMTLTPVFLERPDSPRIVGATGEGIEIRILGALTGRPITLGGFDMTHARPRPNRAYVPAGSAWLIEIQGGTETQRRERLLALHDSHPLGPRDEAALGFGHTLVGLGPLPTEE